MKHLSLIVLIGMAILCAGYFLGWFSINGRTALCAWQYDFINIDAVCGKTDVIKKIGYATTQDQVSRVIKEMVMAGGVANASVYFRDLVHGPTFGVNELDIFAPASLLKLPLAFVYLSAAETNPGLLTQQIKYSGPVSDTARWISAAESAMPDRTYTIEELLRLMLVYSDNTAYLGLEGYLATNSVELRSAIFQELGLLSPRDLVDKTITTRGYASLFRNLYYSSYLSPASSEKLLAWLAEARYDRALAAGVPSEIIVAHKFGERTNPDGTKQLHDCGIVYYPDNPYMLCIMTEGSNFEDLESAIRQISEIVYQEVNSRRIQQ